MGFLRSYIKNWHKPAVSYVAVEVLEHAGFEGNTVTLLSGAQVNRNHRTIYPDKSGASAPLSVVRASHYGSY